MLRHRNGVAKKLFAAPPIHQLVARARRAREKDQRGCHHRHRFAGGNEPEPLWHPTRPESTGRLSAGTCSGQPLTALPPAQVLSPVPGSQKAQPSRSRRTETRGPSKEPAGIPRQEAPRRELPVPAPRWGHTARFSVTAPCQYIEYMKPARSQVWQSPAEWRIRPTAPPARLHGQGDRTAGRAEREERDFLPTSPPEPERQIRRPMRRAYAAMANNRATTSRMAASPTSVCSSTRARTTTTARRRTIVVGNGKRARE